MKDNKYQVVQYKNGLVLEYDGKRLPFQTNIIIEDPHQDITTVTITVLYDLSSNPILNRTDREIHTSICL